MINQIVLIGFMTVCLAGCGTLSSRSSHTVEPLFEAFMDQPPQLVRMVYTLGVADTLDITVYRHPELTRQVRITSEGMFVYPLIGSIKASGRTVAQLEKELTRRLQEANLETPQVAVSVTEYHNQHVYILGEVNSPGVYTLEHDATLKDLIANANGPTTNAGWYVLVVRGDHPRARYVKVRHLEKLPGIRVDLHKLLAGEVERTVHIHSGDMVYVPRRAYFFASK
ncbi:MAG: polysaccharide export protein [Candidatus Tectomicrobia bacterium]|nr:polysaccharide export protein [Candidatus Tectomicrobia bacterium]